MYRTSLLWARTAAFACILRRFSVCDAFHDDRNNSEVCTLRGTPRALMKRWGD